MATYYKYTPYTKRVIDIKYKVSYRNPMKDVKIDISPMVILGGEFLKVGGQDEAVGGNAEKVGSNNK